jgi:hypothetical protein
MKQKTINQIVRATIAEFKSQTENQIAAHLSPAEKYFVWIDLTFRHEEAIKISVQRIVQKWDLSEINLKNGQTLGNYLSTCNVGEIWKTRTEWLECSGIY